MVLSGMVLAILFYAMYLLNRYNLAASTSMNVIHYLQAEKVLMNRHQLPIQRMK